MARSSTSSNRRPDVTNDYKERLEPRLLVAIENDDADALRKIIEEARSKEKLTENFLGMGLMRSSEKGKIGPTRVLLEAGAKPDSTTGNRLSPLLRAVERGNVAIVRLLLEHKADPNVADKKGRTAMMTAAWRNYWHILDLLLKKGADINKKDLRQRNVLHNLAADKKCDWGDVIISLLLEQDIHLDGEEGQDELRRSPLHWACATGKKHLAELLLTRPRGKKADVSAVDIREKTCLHMAASHGRDDIVDMLIHHGAKVDLRSDGGWTPLHNACEKGSVAIVQTLLEHGADVNAKLLNGATPLHLAAQGGFEDVVRCLLAQRDIKRAVRDSFGITPFLRAAQERKKEIVNLLAPFNQVESLSVDALGACNGFNATIVDFGNFRNENQVKKRTVYELLYGRDPINPRKAAINILPKDDKATSFRWIHLPANNMSWVEALLTKSFIEEGSSDVDGFKALEKSFSHQHRGQQTHSHFMRPLCQSTPRAPRSTEDEQSDTQPETPTPMIVINEMPKPRQKPKDDATLKSSTNVSSAESKTDRSKSPLPHGEKDHGKGSHKERGKKTASIGGTRSPKGKENRESHGKPYHGRPHMRSSSTLSLGRKDVGSSHKGNVFIYMPYLHFESDKKRREMQEAISRAETMRLRNPPNLERAETFDEMLIRAHLTTSTVSLHIRRTLDQSFYHNIDTRSRDEDQVVYRYQLKSKEHENPDPKIFMVDQLWMWILGKDLIVTSFPQRWQQPKNDPLNVLDSIIEDINSKTRDPVRSVYDLAMIITGRCSGVFDRHRMGDEDYQFLDMFESSIGSATDSETMLFKEFNDASGQASAWLQHHRRPNGFSRSLEQSDSKDGHEAKEKFKFESLSRGPLFVDKLLDIGQETDLLAETKDIRDELNMIAKVLDDQRQVLPDLQAAICDIYEGEQKPQQEVKKRFREQLKLIEMHIKDIDRMDKQAQRIYSSVTDMLDLKQKHANAFEARFASDQARGTARQSQTIMVFTIVTIIFLPLSFIAAFFAINIREFPRDNDNGNTSLPLSYVSRYLFGIGFAVSIPLIVVALSLDDIVSLFRQASRWVRRLLGLERSEEEAGDSALDTLRMEKAISVARSLRMSYETSNGREREREREWIGRHLSPTGHSHSHFNANGHTHGNSNDLMDLRPRTPRMVEAAEFRLRPSADMVDRGMYR